MLRKALGRTFPRLGSIERQRIGTNSYDRPILIVKSFGLVGLNALNFFYIVEKVKRGAQFRPWEFSQRMQENVVQDSDDLVEDQLE